MLKKVFLFTILFIMFSAHIFSIPAFARKYDMSCNVCHSPFPKLKPYGEEFAANGFKLKDKEPLRYTRDTGDDKLILLRELPLAIRFDSFGSYSTKVNAKSDFQLPYSLKILSGGSITNHISYYFYFYLDERGEIAGVEDAYIYKQHFR